MLCYEKEYSKRRPKLCQHLRKLNERRQKIFDQLEKLDSELKNLESKMKLGEARLRDDKSTKKMSDELFIQIKL
jgi:phage shock protein A